MARIVPLIMASNVYNDNGAIVLWWDESEGATTPANAAVHCHLEERAPKRARSAGRRQRAGPHSSSAPDDAGSL